MKHHLVAELARRAAERHAKLDPRGSLTGAWLATAFLADVAASEGFADLWGYYLTVALEHRARIARDLIVTRRLRRLSVPITDAR